ncbi:SMP-30/gluconolactonase/LRE family protein [Phenylobacterium sp. LjRoot225]|uniref:SMP-30/gluconolactonase/LRE family protein n=1 Tax=Phenylobacterium sp. LjRoot225 TaxID=3342285 RepID=UPI003ED028B7
MGYEVVCRGVYLEGLCADAGVVWVSDPIRGGIRQVTSDGAIKAWLPEKRWVGGLLLNADGKVLISGEGGVIWLDGATGASGLLVDKVDGRPLPGVNEMVATHDGGIYFGSLDAAAIIGGEAPGPASIYRMDVDGGVREVCGGLKFSNGVGVSPDGRRLYHNETFVGVSAYDILPDGSLGPATFLLDKPDCDCDGLAVDADGVVWITGFATSAITCLHPDGALKGLVEFPGGGATNVRFGGPDRRDLYVTSVAAGAADKLKAGIWPTVEESVLYRGRSDVPGLAYRPADFQLGAG